MPQTRTAPTVLPGERASCGSGALPSGDVPGLRSQLHALLDMEELVAALAEAACSCDVVDANDIPRDRVVLHGDVDGRKLRAVTLDEYGCRDLVRRARIAGDVVGSKPVAVDDVAVQGIDAVLMDRHNGQAISGDLVVSDGVVVRGGARQEDATTFACRTVADDHIGGDEIVEDASHTRLRDALRADAASVVADDGDATVGLVVLDEVAFERVVTGRAEVVGHQDATRVELDGVVHDLRVRRGEDTQALAAVVRDVPSRRAEGPGALRGAVVVVHDGVVRDRDPVGTCREDPLTDRILGGEAAHGCARAPRAEDRDGIDESLGIDDRPRHADEADPGLYEGATRNPDAPGCGLHRDGRRASAGSRADRDCVTDCCGLDGSIDIAELCGRANSWKLRSAPEGRNVESAEIG